MPTHAEELMSLALSDPRAALESGDRLLREIDESDRRKRSEVLRAMSMAARHVNELEESIELARRSAEVAQIGGDTELSLQALLTMSGSLAMVGRTNESLDVIDKAIDEVMDPGLRARFEVQRGGVLQIAGRVLEAKAAYLSALPLFREVEDRTAQQLTLNRLGQAFMEIGHLSEAEACLSEALELAQERNELVAAHGIMHNLGLLASYRGDIPEALDWLERSDDLYMEVSGADAPQHVARSEVLISVGRFEEALESARLIAESAGSRDDVEHQADALLVAARAAVMAGRYNEAAQSAGAAAEIYERVAMVTRQAEARGIEVEARFAEHDASRDLLAQAEVVVQRLAQQELRVATAQTRFLCALIAIDLEDLGRARGHLGYVAANSTGPVEVRLQAAVARARLAELADERGRALRAARSGLRLIDRYQSTLGATELRMGIEKHGADLAGMGLRLALDSGRPRRILEWLDMTRARALRVRPVTSAGVDEVGDQLADLRRVVTELRDPAKRNDRALLRRRRDLEESIARVERIRRQQGESPDDVSLRELIDGLGETVLYELGVVDGRLLAVMVRNNRARLVELGDLGEVSSEISHLRFGMRRAARRRRSLDVSLFEDLDRALFGPVDFGEAPVLIVPPPVLMSVPWSGLPRLRDRPLLISPSAEMWWRARQIDEDRPNVLVAGGPDLEVAEDEVRRVAEVHEDARVLLPGATVDDVKSGAEGAGLAHIACHATFQVENPMFSSLRLGDGDLNVYDIERLDRPPSLVVLSACDSGYTEAKTGEEVAGLTSALLSMGTRTVVASVGLVPDSPATSDLMVELHRGLVAGRTPAEALARSQESAFDDPERFISAASFICVGA